MLRRPRPLAPRLLTPLLLTLLLPLLLLHAPRAAAECTSLGFSAGSATPDNIGQLTVMVRAADFNRDGKPDMAVLRSYISGTEGVAILLGNGAGDFTEVSGSPFAANSSGPLSMAVGDLNRDGNPDVVVGNFDNSTGDVAVLLGDGTGALSPASGSPFSAGGEPTSLAIADFNNDGIPDVVSISDNGVSILLGNGGGGLSKTVPSPYAAGTDPFKLVVGDFNGDGDVDVATSNFVQSTNHLRIFFGDGDGAISLASGSPMTISSFSPDVRAAADLNRDGFTDLVMSEQGGQVIRILLGNGSGGFSLASGSPMTVSFATGLTVADMNLDGIPDIALGMSTSGTGTIAVLVGNGSGGFSSPTGSTSSQGVEPTIDVADVDLDGRPDILVTNKQSKNAIALRNTCTQTSYASPGFAAASGSPVAVGSDPQSVAVGDVNGDGKPDIVVGNVGSDNVSVLLGGGAGTFTQPGGTPFGVPGDPQSVVLADADGDGDGLLDVVVARAGSDAGTIYAGLGDGTFTFERSGGTGSGPRAIAVADFDRDGQLDFATANSASNTVTIRLWGTLVYTQPSGSPIAVGSTPWAIATGDFNRDGKPDLVTANIGGNNVTVLLGDGNGGFSQASGSPVAVGALPTDVAVGDFNRDAIPDLAVTNGGAGTVTILIGNGSGGFSQASGSPVDVGSVPRSVAVGDVNLDGREDLVVANSSDGTLTLLLGNGSGGFTEAAGSPVAVGSSPTDVAIADINRDGRPDLVATNSAGNSVSVMLSADGVAPTVQTHPSDKNLCAGTTASFSSTAFGIPAPTVQWQTSTSINGPWSPVSGAMSTTYSVVTTTTLDGRYYRALHTNAFGSAPSAPALLTVRSAPVVQTDPESRTLCAGATITFTASATGSPAPSVQWEASGDGVTWNDMNGATNPTLSFTAAFAHNGQRYRARFTNSCGFVRTQPALLTVNTAPAILTDPASNAPACPGATVEFSSTAVAWPSPSTSWERSTDNGGSWHPLPDVGSPLVVPNVTSSMNGYRYRATFTNLCGSSTSRVAVLSVNETPAIVDGPDDATRCIGAPVTFSASATGTGISYQWLFNGNAIPGAGGPTYHIAWVTTADEGSYAVVVSGTCNPPATSAAAVLTVNEPAAIAIDPEDNAPVCPGADVSFTVTTAGAPTPMTTWERSTDGGASWHGLTETGTTLLVPAVTTAMDGFRYRATAANECGSETSEHATLHVNAVPALTDEPEGATRCEGESVTFTAEATGTGIEYQWRKDGEPIPGADEASYTIAAVSAADAGAYSVVASGACSPAAISEDAVLVVNLRPAIADQPDDVVRCTGESAQFTVGATGTGLTYQWRRNTVPLSNGTRISGATSATLTISGLSTADDGAYDVVVSGTCSPAATSDAATLTVHAPPTITVALSPNSLWPPNHAMRTIEADVDVTGNCTPLTVELVSVTSSEPDDAPGGGDGNTTNDIQGVGSVDDYVFSVRAERAGSGNGRVYTATYRVTDAAGNTATASATVVVPHNNNGKTVVTAVTGAKGGVALEQNQPNPFETTTAIGYWLGEPGAVTLKVYGLDGRLVATLVDGERSAGAHTAVWDGTDATGATVASGVYLYRLESHGTVQQQRMIVRR